jgi:integrase
MARRAQGHKVVLDDGWYYVRFRYNNRRHKLALRTQDQAEAHRQAPEVYAAFIRGERQPIRGAAPTITTPLIDLCTTWLDSLEGVLAAGTRAVYEDYAAAHWLTRWKRLSELTEAALAGYVADRLKKVIRKSVRKEVSALRGFLGWLKTQGLLSEVPTIELPAKAAGTRAKKRRVPVPLSLIEVRMLIAALPEESRHMARSRAPYRRQKFPIRAYATFLWETGLRPSGVERMSNPDNWKPGRDTLTIDDDEDKAAWGREVPLSRRARELLEQYASTPGPLWGRWDLRVELRKAATKIGLDEARAQAVSTYDLRHARINALRDAGASRSGLQLLAGHTDAATTELYMHPLADQAKKALDLLEQPSELVLSTCEPASADCPIPLRQRRRIGSAIGSVGAPQGPLALLPEATVCPVILTCCAKGGT